MKTNKKAQDIKDITPLTFDAISETIASEILYEYVPRLNGTIYFRKHVASEIIVFVEREETSQAEKVRGMAQFLAESLCNPDGSRMVETAEQIMKRWTIEIIDLLATVISTSKKKV